MKKAILTTKVGMTQIFNEDGVLVPVTVLQAGPCVVTQVKTVENDGYRAVQASLTRRIRLLTRTPAARSRSYTDMVLTKQSRATSRRLA